MYCVPLIWLAFYFCISAQLLVLFSWSFWHWKSSSGFCFSDSIFTHLRSAKVSNKTKTDQHTHTHATQAHTDTFTANNLLSGVFSPKKLFVFEKPLLTFTLIARLSLFLVITLFSHFKLHFVASFLLLRFRFDFRQC